MKIFIKRIPYLGVVFLIFSGIISCEEDFKDIGSPIIGNSKFSTKDTILEVVIDTVHVNSVRADGLGEYLLGVYNADNYQKIEASIVSQLRISPTWTVNHLTDKAKDTSYIHTELDAVILRVPYQATRDSETSKYTLDAVTGNLYKGDTIPFTLNVYETDRYLNLLNPENPAEQNSYQSDLEIGSFYSKIGDPLNETINYPFKPNQRDTAFFVTRRAKLQADYGTLGVKDSIIKDTIILTDNKIPFARIPLKKDVFQKKFMNLYESPEFDSQDAFNNYFRGLILEATGDNGFIIPLNFSGNTNPSIELYYTNTVLSKAADTVISISKQNHSYLLGGITSSVYKMSERPEIATGNVVLQGTAGTEAEVKIFIDGLEDLQAKDWLINDASLTLYVDQNIVQYDTINTPPRLFLYKKWDNSASQITDLLPDETSGTSERSSSFGGFIELTTEGKPDKYNFRITDYVSDLLSGDSNNNPPLRLKVHNPTDLPSAPTDTLVENYNWNPKMVTLLNQLSSNGARRARLKISYTVEK